MTILPHGMVQNDDEYYLLLIALDAVAVYVVAVAVAVVAVVGMEPPAAVQYLGPFVLG